MAAQLLSIGMPWVITQNVVYALPTRTCVITSTAPLEKSVDGLSGWTALTSGSVATGFCRCTTTSPTVTCNVATGGAGGGGTVSGDIAVTSVAVGATPAQTGGVRLSFGDALKTRNNGNSADTNLIRSSPGGYIEMGDAAIQNRIMGSLWVVAGTTFNAGVSLETANNYLQLSERSGAPGATADRCTIWAQDNGSGKTQLMCRFGTGANIQIAIEP